MFSPTVLAQFIRWCKRIIEDKKTLSILSRLNASVVSQSTEGRLWDLLFLLHHSARHTHTNIIIYICLFQMAPANPPIPKKIKAHIGPGDTPSPVLTIMLPEED